MRGFRAFRSSVRPATTAFARSMSTSAAMTQVSSKMLFAGVAAAGVAFATYEAAAAPRWGVPGTSQERTFIAIKPDGVQRHLIGEVIKRFEKKGYKLVALKLVAPTEKFAAEHYSDLSKKPFFPGLVKYFSSGPVVAMVWEGQDVIKNGRKIVGATNPADSEAGSIRGDLCIAIGRNVIHGSDSPKGAQDEISLWFTDAEVVTWGAVDHSWIYEK